MLRRIVDIVAIGAAVGVGGVMAWQGYQHLELRNDIKAVSSELRRFEQALSLQAASGQTETNSRGWPVTIEPAWFPGDPPRNILVSTDRPWMEVATLEQAELSDPVIRMTIDRSVAAFWYNPYQGIVRARVPMQMSDSRSLMLYNAVNDTSLPSIHGEPVDFPSPPTEDATSSDDSPDGAPASADDPGDGDEGDAPAEDPNAGSRADVDPGSDGG